MSIPDELDSSKPWRFNKASATGGVAVPSVVIDISEEVRNFPTLENARLNYDAQGGALAELLATTLPGGTLDAMIRFLLERKASLLRVPMFESEGAK